MDLEIRKHLGSSVLPVFRDKLLESDYRDNLFSSRRTLIRNSLILATILFAVVEPVARIWLPSDVPELDSAVRWYIHIPTVLIVLVVFQTSRNYAVAERCLLVALGAILLSNVVLLLVAGPVYRQFYSIASVQIMLFGFMLTGLRFRPAFIWMLFLFGLSALATVVVDGTTLTREALTSPHVTLFFIFFGLAFTAYILDISSRTLFLINLAREREHTEQLAMEAERGRWLKIASDFLNHELKKYRTYKRPVREDFFTGTDHWT